METVLSTSSSLAEMSDMSDSETSNMLSVSPQIPSPEPSTSKGTAKCNYGRQFPQLALACDRTGISDRSAATIVSAVLEDVGLVTKEDPSSVVDRMTIRRARKRSRLELGKESSGYEVDFGLYFDGRKDKTLKQDLLNGKYYRYTTTEEHISLIREPGSIYIGHVTP